MQVGTVGKDSIIYLSEEWSHKKGNRALVLGEVLIIADDNDKDFYYAVKEYKDGWWRLEWPD